MPYFSNPAKNQDDEEQNSNPTNVEITGAAPTANSQGQLDTDPANQQSQGQSKALNTGSGYTDLNKYLNANNAADFGAQVGQKVQGQFDQAKQAQSDTANQFTNEVVGGNQTPTKDQITQAIADPTTADASQYQGWENQNYQGPTSLADNPSAYNQYWNSTNDAQTQAQLLGSNIGRYSLLDSYFGKTDPSGYNTGQKNLDGYLLSNSGIDPTQYRIQGAQLANAGQQGEKAIQNEIGTTIGNVDQSRQLARSTIGIDANGQITGLDANGNATSGGGAIGQAIGQGQQNVASANATRQDEYNQVQKDLASGTVTQDELNQLGLTSGTNLYNLDLNSYLTQGAQLGANDLSSDDQARIQALTQLAGVTDPYSGTAVASTNPYSFDLAKFQSDQQAAADAIAKTQAQSVTSNPQPDFQNEMTSGPLANYLSDAQARAQYQAQIQAQLDAEKQNLLNTYNPSRTLGVSGVGTKAVRK